MLNQQRITAAFLIVLVILSILHQSADAITIDTVPVGNPGNAGDVQSQGTFGAVGYNYRIGKTEVTNAQYVEFLNGVAASDPYGLYHAAMTFDTRGGIDRSGSLSSYSYAVKPSLGQGPGGTDYTYADKPVVFVTWYDSIRFANWLHNRQGSGDTETGAYTLLDGNSITRNAGALWFLPSENEWYKAAYYDPTVGAYYDYPTGTDSVPDNNLPSADSGNSENFAVTPGGFTFTTGNQNHPMTDAGAYMLSASPYGTFDQGGNVTEWTETLISVSRRSQRANHWSGSWKGAELRFSGHVQGAGDTSGFRVATIPEQVRCCFYALQVWRCWAPAMAADAAEGEER